MKKKHDAKSKKNSLPNGESLAKRSFGFVSDIKLEFKKLSWTAPEELKTYTKVVLASTVGFGMLVFVADLFIKNTLDAMRLVLGIFSS